MRRAGFTVSVAAFGVAIAGAARAQDAPAFDPAPTEHCLAAAQEPDKCIGRAADACMSGPGADPSTVGMVRCLDGELRWWDGRLNAAYSRLMAIEKASDAEMAEIGATVPSASATLRAMQRAWIAWRDAACEYERVQWGGGTGGGPASAACWMKLTGSQALALEAHMGGNG